MMRFLLVIAALLGPDVASASVGWWAEEDAIHVSTTAAIEARASAREPPPPRQPIRLRASPAPTTSAARAAWSPAWAGRDRTALRTVRRLLFAPTSDDDDAPLS
jgi:hypothetical protein